MAKDDSDTVWLVELRRGNANAAQAIWERYFDQLVRLARKKLGRAPRRAADEEDVALSAFDSFVQGAKAGRFPKLDDRDDLWQVLVLLTARKAVDQIVAQKREKRGGGQVRGESVFDVDPRAPERRGLNEIVGGEPTPEFAVLAAEECARRLDQLGDESLRAVARAKLEGYSNDEIAERMQCGLRTVERKLRLIRAIWSKQP